MCVTSDSVRSPFRGHASPVDYTLLSFSNSVAVDTYKLSSELKLSLDYDDRRPNRCWHFRYSAGPAERTSPILTSSPQKKSVQPNRKICKSTKTLQ